LETLLKKIGKKIRFYFRFLLWKIAGVFKKQITVSTKQGTFTVFCQDKEISKDLFCHRDYDREFYFKVFKFLSARKSFKKGTLVDIGANIGVTAIGVINDKLIEKAIAIESEPENFSLLEKNIKANYLEKLIIPLLYAVSDMNGNLPLELSENIFGDHRIRQTFKNNVADGPFNESRRKVIKVKAQTIDSIIDSLPKNFTREISLIWSDVQGYEGYVFKGGRQIFATGVPVVAEIWPYGIKRSGMSEKEFCRIAQNFWSSFWVLRQENFVKYPSSLLKNLFTELGEKGNYTNVIFTK